MDNIQELPNRSDKIISNKVNKALFYHVFWTLAPVIAGGVMLVLSSRYADIISLVDKGDLCLTSTAFFASSYFLYNENKDSTFEQLDRILSSLCFPLIFIIAFIYGKAFQHSLKLDSSTETINFYFLRISSIIFLLTSIFAFYRALKIDFKKFTPSLDAKEEEKIEIKNIMDQLGED